MRGGVAPIADLAKEMRLIELLLEAKPLFSAAHDLSQGGLASTLIEMVLRYNVGAAVEIENPGITLLSETPGRVVVAVKPSKAAQLTAIAGQHKIEIKKIGTTGGAALTINDCAISLDELRRSHTETFKRLFG
jgi:phosphoribosylformylglycinamidine synthase